MNASEAAAIIENMAYSLKEQPQQFNIEVSVTGQRNVSYGGTGLSITAIGGASGSTTIGQRVSVDGSQVQLAQKVGRQVMTQQTQALIQALETIAAELRSPSPDKSKVSRLMDSLRGNWVPPLITSTVANLLSSALSG